MQLYRHFAIAAALLLCSIAAASAAGTGPFLVASDDFVLTGAQEQLLWQRIGRNAGSTTPSGLIAAVGAIGRATRTACNRHPADTGGKTLQVRDTRQDAADHKPHRPGHRRRHYAIRSSLRCANPPSRFGLSSSRKWGPISRKRWSWVPAFAGTTAYELVSRNGINRRWEAVAW